nr:MYCBP-associated protein-like isoform X3 [Biomphalaria glabrata]
MGPKTGKQKLLKIDPEQAPEVLEEVDVVEKEADPYESLRYTPQKKVQKCKLQSQTRYVPVRKKPKLAAVSIARQDDDSTEEDGCKKHKSFSAQDAVRASSLLMSAKKNEKYQLEMDVISAPPLTKWVSPSELPLLPPPVQVLTRRKPLASSVRQLMAKKSQLQARNLDHFVEVKEKQIRMENYLMAATGKNRSNLLVRRQQLLPKIPPANLEQPLIRLEKALPPVKESAVTLFGMAEHMKLEKRGICPRLTKKQQGYSMVSEWVGCPEVTDVIFQKLGFGNEDDQEEEYNFGSVPEGERSEYVPQIEKLGLVGDVSPVFVGKARPSVPKIRMTVQIASLTKSQETGYNKHSNKHFTASHHLERASIFSYGFGDSESSVGLIIGDSVLSWSVAQESRIRSEIIEVGCTADLGKNEICSIKLTNTGTTAINYKFVRKDHKDAFDLKKYRLTRFIIDGDNRVILPGETFQVPVLYKGVEPGYYTEDWCLLTRPVLENGAEIILRLWGITRGFDSFINERELIEKILHKRETIAVVQDRIDKILKNLPLKETIAVDDRFQHDMKGPDLFRFHNPGLHYRMPEVFRLGKLLEMLDVRKTKPMTPKKLANKSESLMDSLSNLEASIQTFFVDPAISFTEEKEHEDDNEDDEVEDDDEEDYFVNEQMPIMFEPKSSVALNAAPGKKSTIDSWQTYMLRKINAEMKAKSVMFTTSSEYFGKSAILHSSLMNIVNCDISVDELENRILDEVDLLEEQEAYFNVMSQQTSRLCFSTDTAVSDVSSGVALTLLMNTIDRFCDFATKVKLQCCENLFHNTIRKANTDSQISVLDHMEDSTLEVLLEGDGEKLDAASSSSIAKGEDVYDVQGDNNDNNVTCDDFIPRNDMEPKSYKAHYYDKIYTKMYLLLCDYFDSLDLLLSHLCQKKDKRGDTSTLLPGIQRVSIKANKNETQALLSAPLPPSWTTKMSLHKGDKVIKKTIKKGNSSKWNKVHNVTDISRTPSSVLMEEPGANEAENSNFLANGPPDVQTMKTLYVLRRRKLKKSSLDEFSMSGWTSPKEKLRPTGSKAFLNLITDTLADDIIFPKKMSVREPDPSTPEPWHILHRQPPYDRLYHVNLEKSLNLEKSSLQLFEKMKRHQLKTENFLMEKTGKKRSGLLLRRKQLLPKLHSHSDERDLLELNIVEKPKEVPQRNIFVYDKYNTFLKRDLLPAISKKDMGFPLVQEYVGCPDVTDYILGELGMSSRHKTFGGSPMHLNDSYSSAPFIPLLGVLGSKSNRQKSGLRIETESVNTSFEKNREAFSRASESVYREKLFYDNLLPNDLCTRVALTFGNHHLEWTTNQERGSKTWIVSVGCSAEHGQRGFGSVTLKNTGTCAIYFHFEKEDTVNALKTSLSLPNKFVFDSWGGVILPNEVFRVPFLYHAYSLGIYSENWRLITKPVLENGAKILMRISGTTMYQDMRIGDPCAIEKRVQEFQATMIAKQIVDDLIRHLPLSDFMLKNTVFPNVCSGPDVFLALNQGFYYKTASVYRLGKLLHVLEHRKLIKEEGYGEDIGYSESFAGPRRSSSFEYPELEDEENEFEDYGEEESDHDVYVSSPPKFNKKSLYMSLKRKTRYQSEIDPVRTLYFLLDPDSPRLKVFSNDIDESLSPEALQASDLMVAATDSNVRTFKRRIYPRAPVNLTFTDFKIDKIRDLILEDSSSVNIQNTHFAVLSNEVDKLSFRQFEPLAINLKLLIAKTLLCHFLDTFCDSVHKLKLSCNLEESYMLLPNADWSHRKVKSDGDMLVSKYLNKVESWMKRSNNLLRSISSPGARGPQSPKETRTTSALENRYQCCYMPSLYATMYQLLSDYFDQLDELFNTLTDDQDKPTRPDTFIKVTRISMPATSKDIVYGPRERKAWIQLTEQMAEIANKIKRNKSVNWSREVFLQEPDGEVRTT